MSSHRRPWYKWFPGDFEKDEKVKPLSPLAELVYRRALDTMWEASACCLLNDCFKLAGTLGKGLSQQEFEKAWNEIQYPGFEILKSTEDGKWLYSDRLKEQLDALQSLSKIRKLSGKKGATAKAIANRKQKPSKSQAKAKHLPTDTDTDTDSTTPFAPSKGEGQKKNASDPLFDLFIETVTNLPKPSSLSKKRKERCVMARKEYNLDWWKSVFETADSIPALYSGNNESKWKADFDWLIGVRNQTRQTGESITNALKVIEGKCDGWFGHGRTSAPERVERLKDMTTRGS